MGVPSDASEWTVSRSVLKCVNMCGYRCGHGSGSHHDIKGYPYHY